MTTENVDIQVQGQVKPDIQKNLRAIADAASSGYKSVERLQNMLNQLDAGGLNAVQQASARLDSQLEAQNRALADANAAYRMQTANTRVLSAQVDRLTSELNSSRAAQEQANQASQRAVALAEQQASAQSNSKARLLELARAGVAEAQAQRDRTNAMLEAARATNTGSESIRRNVQFTQEQIRAAQEATRAARDQVAAMNQQAAAADALVGAQQRTTHGWQDYNAGIAKTGQNAQLARHHLVNLGFQLQDIGVSLASGQNPLTVAIQQGAQIQGIAAQAGVGLRTMAAGVAALLVPFLPFAAAVAAVVAGLKIMSSELSKDSGLEKYSKSLGLTQKQIKQLDGDVVTITDTFKAFFTTVGEESGLSKAFDSFLDSAIKAFKNVVGYALDAFNAIGALSSATAQTFLTAWDKLPTGFKNIFVDIYNTVVGIIEALVNFTIAGVNQMIAGINKVSTIKIEPFAAIPMERMSYSQDGGNPKDLADTFMDTFKSSFNARNKEFADFYAKWQKNSIAAARARIKEDADKLGGKNTAEESRAAAMAKLNAQLDNEIARLTMLKPIREQQQKFDQIEEALLGRKIRLTEAEAASIKDRLLTIAEGIKVQQQADRIYEETRQASEDYNSTLAAAQQLLEQGAIGQDVYNAKTNAAQEAYENALDPLRKYRQEIEFMQQTVGMNNDQLAIATQRRNIEQESLRNGIAIRKEDVDALMRQAEAAQYAQGVQQQYNQIWGESSGALQQNQQRVEALQLAYQNGLIGLQAFNAQMVQTKLEAANLRIAMDQAMPGDYMLGMFEQTLSGFKTLASGVVDSLGTMFSSLTDGLANALAGAISGTQSLGDALRNVAQNAVQQLISSLIKLGLQWALNAALSQTLGTAVVATTATQAALTASAWAPAAALASLATLGANAGPATMGMGSTMVAAKSFAALGGVGFQDGGYTGNGPIDKVAGVVHAGEYVMRADTVARLGLDTMDAIQNGQPIGYTSQNSQVPNSVASGVKSNSAPNVTVNFIEDASKAGTVETREDENGNQYINGFVANIREQGEAATALEQAYGLKRVGQ